jgi:hypothetical protein
MSLSGWPLSQPRIYSSYYQPPTFTNPQPDKAGWGFFHGLNSPKTSIAQSALIRVSNPDVIGHLIGFLKITSANRLRFLGR